MFYALRDHGQSMAWQDLASAITADVETVKRKAREHRQTFVVMQGGRVGLSAKGQDL